MADGETFTNKEDEESRLSKLKIKLELLKSLYHDSQEDGAVIDHSALHVQYSDRDSRQTCDEKIKTLRSLLDEVDTLTKTFTEPDDKSFLESLGLNLFTKLSKLKFKSHRMLYDKTLRVHVK